MEDYDDFEGDIAMAEQYEEEYYGGNYDNEQAELHAMEEEAEVQNGKPAATSIALSPKHRPLLNNHSPEQSDLTGALNSAGLPRSLPPCIDPPADRIAHSSRELTSSDDAEGWRSHFHPAAAKSERIPPNRFAPAQNGEKSSLQLEIAAELRGIATKTTPCFSVLNRPPLDADHIQCLTGAGSCGYLKLVPASEPTMADSRVAGKGSLLEVPFEELMKRIENKQILVNAGLSEATQPTKSEEAPLKAGKGGRSAKHHGKPESRLWVDKYAPSRFPHLLSDERINRDVLQAIKAWDAFVFGNANSTDGEGKGSAQTNPLALQKTAKQVDTQSNKPAAPAQTEGEREKNHDKRPELRVVLLCGPPGMGKTTLAHVVAKQAGYRPLEINASDDRTASVLQEKVISAMENRSLFGQGCPNCIILDEVDGVEGKATIDALISIINAPLPAKVSKQNGEKGKGGTGDKKKKGGKITHALTRPLILICNNQYAPHLRELRQVAQIFPFKKTSPQRMVQRLKTICTAERLTASQESLSALCESTGYDIRSSLNTLQFAHFRSQQGQTSSRQGSRSKSMTDVSANIMTAIASGLKDERRDIFQIWDTIFRPPTRSSVTAEDKTRTGVSMIIEEMELFNDHQKILDGVHENYPHLRYTDPDLRRTARVSDWLMVADSMHGWGQRSGDYSFQRYVPFAAAAAHVHCRVDGPKPQFLMPKSSAIAAVNREMRSGLLTSFDQGRHPHSSGRGSPAVTALDTISQLLRIICPYLRCVTLELFAPGERSRLNDAVLVMLANGLTFKPSKRQDHGAYNKSKGDGLGGVFDDVEWVLEPAINHLAMFTGLEPPDMLLTPLRKLAAHEVLLAGLRQLTIKQAPDRNDGKPLAGRDVQRPNDPIMPVSEEQPPFIEAPKRPAVTLPEDSELRAKRLRGSTVQAMVPMWNKGKSRGGASGVEASSGVMDKLRFRFQAGYTNAIRRPVKMKDLL